MRIGGEDLLSWGGADPAQTLHSLLQAVARLLRPDVEDSPSLGVGEVWHSSTSLWYQHVCIELSEAGKNAIVIVLFTASVIVFVKMP